MTGTKDGIRMARSKAGHDRGRVYVIVREEGDFFYLADGAARSVSAPKKKNRKHIQIIEKIPAQVLAVFTSKDPLRDLEIKRALKLYSQTDAEREEKECQKQM